jgi:hypothetical protein
MPALDHVPTPAEILALQLTEAGISFGTEFHFHPRREWRADLCLPAFDPDQGIVPRILVEVEGGAWLKGGGRHNRGKGFEADMEKYAEAIMLGYILLRVSPRQIMSCKALEWIIGLLAVKEKPK